MSHLSYNYVFFNTIESKMYPNPNGYYTICTRDLETQDYVEVVNVPLIHKPYIIRWLYNVHNSEKINRMCNLPFKNIWYPYIFKNIFPKSKPLCFIFLNRYPLEYCYYLKKKYPRSKLVLLYRDLRKITEMSFPDYPDHPIWDLQMSIDEKESMKYGWIHFNEFESKIEVPISKQYPESDIFFAGKAKDRLPRLLKAYDILSAAGLTCSFYLTDVPLEERVNLPGVIYADRPMPYTKMLYHTVNSKCVLEINQTEAVGYTSRFLEAVMFNKRLITDNMAVRNTSFYNPAYIQCISDINEISISFIRNTSPVDYNYNNEFSPIHLIELIDKNLV